MQANTLFSISILDAALVYTPHYSTSTAPLMQQNLLISLIFLGDCLKCIGKTKKVAGDQPHRPQRSAPSPATVPPYACFYLYHYYILLYTISSHP